MAHRIDSSDGVPGSWSRRYPWHEWSDGSTWSIRQGDDYDVATENMRVNLHMKARQVGCKVRTKKADSADGEGLVFQFMRTPSTPLRESAGGGAGDALEALYRDCREIYERARQEVTIPRSDGTRQKYAAIRFMRQIDRAHADGQLVEAVASIVERRTQGFGHLEAARRPDLMLETYLLDESKPYHKLLSSRTLERAAERMAEYWNRHPEADPPVGDSRDEG